MKAPVHVAVTGAAGQIGYALLFRIAAGDMLGKDQPVILHLLEITPALKALEGVVMELNDCAFPLLQGIVATDDANVAFKDCAYALLVGARPRGPGMERKDLLSANGAIFGPQGKALNAHAKRDVKVLVVGNPANTNALIAQANAPDLDPKLLHGDAAPRPQPRHQPAGRQDRRGSTPTSRRSRCGATTRPRSTPTCTTRRSRARPRSARSIRPGTKMISSRPCRSAARPSSRPAAPRRRPRQPRPPSTTCASWALGTADGDWVSMGVTADGSYGIEKGVIYGYPCTCKDGKYTIVQGLEINAFSRARMDETAKELHEERAAVAELIGG